MTVYARVAAAILTASATLAPAALAADAMTKELLAIQLRKQGYACTNPLAAERDTAQSKPLEAVWLLRCENGTFRLRLVPDMAATVETVE